MEEKVKNTIEILIKSGQVPDFEELTDTKDGVCLDTQWCIKNVIFRKLEYEDCTLYVCESKNSLIITE